MMLRDCKAIEGEYVKDDFDIGLIYGVVWDDHLYGTRIPWGNNKSVVLIEWSKNTTHWLK